MTTIALTAYVRDHRTGARIVAVAVIDADLKWMPMNRGDITSVNALPNECLEIQVSNKSGCCLQRFYSQPAKRPRLWNLLRRWMGW